MKHCASSVLVRPLGSRLRTFFYPCPQHLLQISCWVLAFSFGHENAPHILKVCSSCLRLVVLYNTNLSQLNYFCLQQNFFVVIGCSWLLLVGGGWLPVVASPYFVLGWLFVVIGWLFFVLGWYSVGRSVGGGWLLPPHILFSVGFLLLLVVLLLLSVVFCSWLVFCCYRLMVAGCCLPRCRRSDFPRSFCHHQLTSLRSTTAYKLNLILIQWTVVLVEAPCEISLHADIPVCAYPVSKISQ